MKIKSDFSEEIIMHPTLLNKVFNILSKYDSIAAITGENFNIFNITGITASEVTLHSSLLAELLNPKGKHGLNRVFFDYFLKDLKSLNNCEAHNEVLLNFENKNITIKKEDYIGPINDDYSNGGSIDIIIKTDDKDVIIIENKIYASDQHKQLRRYHNTYENALIIYLTLDGREPDDYTTCNNNSSFKINAVCISYKDFIIRWLEDCKKESVDKPLLRETLTQYIYLLKQLTNQTTNDNMKNEIVDLICNNVDFINSADQIWKNEEEIKLAIIDRVVERTRNLAKQEGWELVTDKKRIGLKESKFSFFLKDKVYYISFYFPNKFETIEVGLEWVDGTHSTESLNKLRSNFNNQKNNFQTVEHDGWIVWRYFEEWSETPWSEIEKVIPTKVIEQTKKLKNILSSFDESESSTFNI